MTGGEATPNTTRQNGSTAICRNQRLDHWCVICRFHHQGHSVCPLLCARGFQCHMVRSDWMRMMGPAVVQDFIGQLLVSAGQVFWTETGRAMRELAASSGGSCKEVPVRFQTRFVEVQHVHRHAPLARRRMQRLCSRGAPPCRKHAE